MGNMKNNQMKCYDGLDHLVLVLQDCHSVLQALDVLLLLVPALPGSFSVLHQSNLPLSLLPKLNNIGQVFIVSKSKEQRKDMSDF